MKNVDNHLTGMALDLLQNGVEPGWKRNLNILLMLVIVSFIKHFPYRNKLTGDKFNNLSNESLIILFRTKTNSVMNF